VAKPPAGKPPTDIVTALGAIFLTFSADRRGVKTCRFSPREVVLGGNPRVILGSGWMPGGERPVIPVIRVLLHGFAHTHFPLGRSLSRRFMFAPTFHVILLET
jgi:hypothetical protein